MTLSTTVKNIFVFSTISSKRECSRPEPACIAMLNLGSGRIKIIWSNNGEETPRVHLGPDDLCICFDALPILACFLALGWPLPPRLFDVRVEIRNMLNGNEEEKIVGLPQATKYFGIDVDFGTVQALWKLENRGAPYTVEGVTTLQAHCEKAVEATAKLYEIIRPSLSSTDRASSVQVSISHWLKSSFSWSGTPGGLAKKALRL